MPPARETAGHHDDVSVLPFRRDFELLRISLEAGTATPADYTYYGGNGQRVAGSGPGTTVWAYPSENGWICGSSNG